MYQLNGCKVPQFASKDEYYLSIMQIIPDAKGRKIS